MSNSCCLPLLHHILRSDKPCDHHRWAQVTTTANMCLPGCVTYGLSGGSTTVLQQKEYSGRMYMLTSLTEYSSHSFSWECPSLRSVLTHSSLMLCRQEVSAGYFRAQLLGHSYSLFRASPSQSLTDLLTFGKSSSKVQTRGFKR